MWGGLRGDFLEGADDPACAGGTEFDFAVRPENTEDATAGGDACTYATGGIFDHKALGGGLVDEFRATAVGFGIGLAVHDHVAADDALWNWQLGGFQTAEK